ncbi:cyclic nucleotide-binding domain-containing protein [Candidatus Nomurabacteria bacterium]|nr:cyclic nucleotide-binding domain-containing protein [Candidatus Nomurabacteria bacterium]
MNGFKLEQITLFQNLSKSELKIVSNFLLEKNYQAEDKIFKKDSIRDKVIIIKDGLVKLQTEIADHQEIIALFKDGDFLGEMAFLEKGSHHQHSLEVASPRLSTLEFSVYHWYKILKEHPEISRKIYQNIAISLKNRLDHANNKLVTLFASGQIIAKYDNIEDISRHLIEIIQKVIPCQKTLFITSSQGNERFVVRHLSGYKNIKLGEIFNANQDPLLEEIMTKAETKIFQKNTWPKNFINLKYVSNSLIVAPIKIARKITGFIILADKLNGRAFSMNNQILLEAIATQIAPIIEEERLLNFQNSSDDLKRVYIDPFSS